MSSESPFDHQEFEQTLAEVERSLHTLQARYAQVQSDQQRQQVLKQRLNEIERNPASRRAAELKTELKRIQTQLDELEIALESHLFSWGSLKNAFWQAVRFGGLGLVAGWVLKSIAG